MTSSPPCHTRLGKGEPLVLLHGFASSSLFWSPILERLAQHYDVIALDWPGFGAASEQPPCRSLPDFSAHVLHLLQHLQLNRCHVLGFSMSGFVVQHLLAHHPERLLSATLYGGGTHIDPTRRFEPVTTTLQRLRAEGVTATAQRVLPKWFMAGAASPHLALCEAAAAGMTLTAAETALTTMANANFEGQPYTTPVPTLVIQGDHDHTHPPASALALWQNLPQARLAILPGCGHAAHLEQPELFCRILLTACD